MILNSVICASVIFGSVPTSSVIEDQYRINVDETKIIDDDYFNDRTLRYQNHIYKEGISTPVANLSSYELSAPHLKLNSQDVIDFFFDDLNDGGDYYYTVIHCTHDWHPSDLMESEYIDGFADNPINDYESSFNTWIPYINYHVNIPNDDMKLTKSGNYLFLVYENGDREQPVLSHRFVVYEELTSVEINIERPADVDDMNYKQEVDFIIDHKNLYLSDPFNEIHVAVLQNNRWDNAITGLSPQFIQNNRLVYDYSGDCTFEGNNEFRYLDLKSTKFKGEKIRSIKIIDTQYVYVMKPELKRSYLQYLTQHDINGQFIIREENAQYSHTDADYVKVRLYLNVDEPYTEGNVYVFGGLSGWTVQDRFKMEYSPRDNQYSIEMEVKQGYYNFLFGIPEDDGSVNTTIVEGSHYETENSYTILVYQTVFSEGYDRVIGLGNANSVKN